MDFTMAIHTHVAARLNDHGLTDTPQNRWQILEDLRYEAICTSVINRTYRIAIDRVISQNNFMIEFGA